MASIVLILSNTVLRCFGVIFPIGFLIIDFSIVKMKPEPEAYKDGRDFFLEHEEYTHLVICPDDLVIYYVPFMKLRRETEKYDFPNLCGISNLDEDRPNLYC